MVVQPAQPVLPDLQVQPDPQGQHLQFLDLLALLGLLDQLPQCPAPRDQPVLQAVQVPADPRVQPEGPGLPAPQDQPEQLVQPDLHRLCPDQRGLLDQRVQVALPPLFRDQPGLLDQLAVLVLVEQVDPLDQLVQRAQAALRRMSKSLPATVTGQSPVVRRLLPSFALAVAVVVAAALIWREGLENRTAVAVVAAAHSTCRTSMPPIYRQGQLPSRSARLAPVELVAQQVEVRALQEAILHSERGCVQVVAAVDAVRPVY